MIYLRILLRSLLFTAGKRKRWEQSWPRTLEDAAARAFAQLWPESRIVLRNMKREDLIQLHFSYGMGLRNEFGLWAGNRELQRSCGLDHPDSASQVIIERVWELLQTTNRTAD